MADRRRRRRRLSNSESELSEDEIPNPPKPSEEKKPESECEASSEPVDGTTTEVGTQEEDDDEDDDEEYDEEETEDDEDTETTCTEYDEDSVIIEDGWIETERQSGDGEEQPDKNQEADLDDDEDQKNPAYIPRKGAFYEHDTRDYEEQKEEKLPKKKLWKDDGKWDHDRYRPELQGPKSREELVAAYGYDIREADRPPDAPRRSDKPRRGRGKRALGDFMAPRVKDQLRSRGDNRGQQWGKPELDSPRYDQDQKSNFNDNKDFPVLNRKTMMYEYPDQNSAQDTTPQRDAYQDTSNHDNNHDNYQGNNQDVYNKGGGYNNGQRSVRDSDRGYGRGPGRGGRGGRDGDRGGSDRGGRGGSRGGRGGSRGGYNNNSSYSDLRSRNERNTERYDRSDYNNTPKNDRYERNYGNNGGGNYGNNSSNYGNNSGNYSNNSGPSRKEKFDSRRGEGYDNERSYSQRGAGYPGPGGDNTGGRQWQNAYNNSRSPPDNDPRTRRNAQDNKPVETIVITNTGRKTELLADIPPEIVPPVTSANPHAFQPPLTSSSSSSSAASGSGVAGERKSYARERERRGKTSGFTGGPGKPSTTAGGGGGGPGQQAAPHQPGPGPRASTETGKPVYHHSNMTAGTGRVGHGHSSGPVTLTSSSTSKPHSDSQPRSGFTAPPAVSQVNKGDQSRPKRYSSQRQRGAPDAAYPEPASADSVPPAQPPASQPAPRGAPPPPHQVAPQRMAGPRVTTAHTTTTTGPRPTRPSAPNTSPNARARPFYPGAMYQGTVAAPVFRPPGPQDQSPPHTGAAFSQTALVQQPVAYAMPPPAASAVSQTGPRPIYTPTVAMTTPQPMMQASYMATPIMTYPAPPTGPPAGPYPIQGHVAMQAFPPTPQTLQAPGPVAAPAQNDVVHVKGGTTYFNPVLQQPSPSKTGTTYFNPVLQQPSPSRPSARRPKAAIPIVNPQDVQSTIPEEGYDDQYYEEGELTEEYEPDDGQHPTSIVSQLSSNAQEFIPRHLITENPSGAASSEAQAQSDDTRGVLDEGEATQAQPEITVSTPQKENQPVREIEQTVEEKPCLDHSVVASSAEVSSGDITSMSSSIGTEKPEIAETIAPALDSSVVNASDVLPEQQPNGQISNSQEPDFSQKPDIQEVPNHKVDPAVKDIEPEVQKLVEPEVKQIEKEVQKTLEPEVKHVEQEFQITREIEVKSVEVKVQQDQNVDPVVKENEGKTSCLGVDNPQESSMDKAVPQPVVETPCEPTDIKSPDESSASSVQGEVTTADSPVTA